FIAVPRTGFNRLPRLGQSFVGRDPLDLGGLGNHRSFLYWPKHDCKVNPRPEKTVIFGSMLGSRVKKNPAEAGSLLPRVPGLELVRRLRRPPSVDAAQPTAVS